MNVILNKFFDLYICSDAIRECHGTKDKSDKKVSLDGTITEAGDKDKSLIKRIGNKLKHGSTLEHLVYNFQISGISRALLQELARHRMASLTVKSTRYTLSELADADDILTSNSCGSILLDINWDTAEKFLVMTPSEEVNEVNARQLGEIQRLKRSGVENDILKFALPEAYMTSLTYTINARSLQNFINLRTADSALWEIRILANAMFEALPEEHKYLFEEFNHFDMVETKE